MGGQNKPVEGEGIAKFMGGVEVELKNIYRSLDDMRGEIRANNEQALKTAETWRGIFEEFQKCNRQENIGRDGCIKEVTVRIDTVEALSSLNNKAVEKIDVRLQSVESNQWKITAGVTLISTGVAAAVGFFHDYFFKNGGKV